MALIILSFIVHLTYAMGFILWLYNYHFTIFLEEHGKNGKVIVFKMLTQRPQLKWSVLNAEKGDMEEHTNGNQPSLRKVEWTNLLIMRLDCLKSFKIDMTIYNMQVKQLKPEIM